MSKLTKAQKASISQALYHAERAQVFLMQPGIHIVKESKTTAFPASSWTNGEGTPGIAITKEYGSNLTGIQDAIRTLRALLEVSQ